MKKYICISFLFFLVLLVYKSWFLPGLISSGDFWPYFKSMYSLRSVIPYAWDPNGGNGLGASSVPFLWILMNFGISIDIFGKFFGLKWELVERLAYLFPFLIISIISINLLYRKVVPESKLSILSSGIFLFNSYILYFI